MAAGHLRKELEADNTASFYFVDGLYDVAPFPDIEYQCPPPNLIYFHHHAVSAYDSSFQDRVRELGFVSNDAVEDRMRTIWQKYGPTDHHNATSVTLEYIQNIIEDEGPFHGVIGASEGGCAAATVLLDHQQRSRDANTDSPMMCGIFFVSPPALQPDGMGYVLSDKTDERISVPTCHIFSDSDPLSWMARCLVNLCQEDGREVILHDQGHTIPHTKELMVGVANFVRRVKAAAAADTSAI